MAPTPDDLRDLRWLLRILNRSTLEARYPRWRVTRADGSVQYENDSEMDLDEEHDQRLVRGTAALADDAA